MAAPRWRAAQASAIADVFATRFPAVFTRAAFALMLSVCGWAMAATGLGYAALTFPASLGLSANAAMALAAAALVVSLAPGGLRSLVWTDAASAGAGFATMGLLVALSVRHGADNVARLEAASHALGRLPGAPLLQEIAAAAAVASLFAFVNPALAVATPGAARRAGMTALLVLGVGGALAAALGDLTTRSPSDSSLAALIACLPALALARAGLYASSRALGLDLLRAPKRLFGPGQPADGERALRRAVGAARIRRVARLSPHPSAPLYLALALWLAFAAPSLVLSALPGRGAAPASAALVASLLAAVVGRFAGFGDPGYGPDLLVGALAAGMVGLAAGLAAYALMPRRSRRRPASPTPTSSCPASPPRRDPASSSIARAASYRRGSPAAMMRPPSGGFAVPGRDDAARALDDRGERDDVVRLQIGLDDEIDEAGGERAIGVAVGAVAHQPRLPLDLEIGGAVGVVLDQRGAGGHHRRLRERRAGAGAQRRASPIPSAAARRASAPACAGARACRRRNSARA